MDLIVAKTIVIAIPRCLNHSFNTLVILLNSNSPFYLFVILCFGGLGGLLL